ncbi:MAG: Holliday junction branch migration protein RuvA, partial [Oscillospiraceae bacterium]|nr:Holliday junction branch migration protein RuvA [Oscillospiraceae bacterium]
MLYALTGTVEAVEENLLAVNCSGVVFACACSANTLRAVGKPGETATVRTYLSVREDAMDLYAFHNAEELKCFKQLIAISGVGPKAALRLLSAFTTSALAQAISLGDSKALTRAEGVGAKMAQRLIAELKDKVAGYPVGGGGRIAAAAGGRQGAPGHPQTQGLGAPVAVWYSPRVSAPAG